MKIIKTDPDKCIGYLGCEYACAYHYTGSTCEREWSNIQVKESPDGRKTAPVVCRQCKRTKCLEVCPVHVISRDENTGAVVVDQKICKGCGACVKACPFGSMHFDPVKHTAKKCDLCGGSPACVEHCVAGALTNEYFTAQELYARIWGKENLGDVRTVQVHIHNMRKKIEKDPANPIYLTNEWGKGYFFCPELHWIGK